VRWIITLVLLTAGLSQGARDLSDSDRDGYPDALELVGQDRAAFSDWFAAVAESQFYGLSNDWNLKDRDCAGLLRYAFVQALEKKDRAWWAKFTYIPRPRYPEVRAYGYPMPILSRSVFRQAPGAFQPDDVVQGRFVGRVGAKYLANFSSVFVTRDWRQARRGDIVYFLRPGLASYHSMVYLGQNAQGEGMVVYHTGGSVADGGEVRLLSLTTLMKHPDSAFHPTVGNPSFLGFYRWKIAQ
jgi:uncharacterized protein YfaT (DUF1175 family)